MHKASQAYMQTQVTTTGQGEIVVLLFNGALNFLHQAKEAIDAKDYEKKGQLISKALDIINELESTLNMEKGGDLVKNLRALYAMCTKKLLLANMKMDVKQIDEVLPVLSGIRDAFAQIVDHPEAKAAAEKIALSQQSSQSEQRNVHADSRVGFTSNARAHNFYAKNTTDLGATPTISSPQATALSKESPPFQQPSVSPSEVTTKSPIAEKTAPEEQIKETASPSGFGGAKMPNMDLYRKFAAQS